MKIRKVAGFLASVSLIGLGVQAGISPASATSTSVTIADTQGFYSLDPPRATATL